MYKYVIVQVLAIIADLTFQAQWSNRVKGCDGCCSHVTSETINTTNSMILVRTPLNTLWTPKLIGKTLSKPDSPSMCPPIKLERSSSVMKKALQSTKLPDLHNEPLPRFKSTFSNSHKTETSTTASEESHYKQMNDNLNCDSFDPTQRQANLHGQLRTNEELLRPHPHVRIELTLFKTS